MNEVKLLINLMFATPSHHELMKGTRLNDNAVGVRISDFRLIEARSCTRLGAFIALVAASNSPRERSCRLSQEQETFMQAPQVHPKEHLELLLPELLSTIHERNNDFSCVARLRSC